MGATLRYSSPMPGAVPDRNLDCLGAIKSAARRRERRAPSPLRPSVPGDPGANPAGLGRRAEAAFSDLGTGGPANWDDRATSQATEEETGGAPCPHIEDGLGMAQPSREVLTQCQELRALHAGATRRACRRDSRHGRNASLRLQMQRHGSGNARPSAGVATRPPQTLPGDSTCAAMTKVMQRN